MRDEQRIIVGWMQRQLDRMGVKPDAWARKAGVSPTTVTRAMKDDYESITAIPTLHSLAQAAGTTSVLDFLAGDLSAPRAPSADAMKPILTAVLQRAPKGRLSEPDIERLAQALEYGLGLVAAGRATPASPDAIDVAGRAAADRFQALRPEA